MTAQFDVHRNRGRQAAAVPFVVVLQSRRFDGAGTRVVAPLVANPPGVRQPYPDLSPSFTIDGRRVVRDPLLMQTVPRHSLGERVANLADDESSARIIKAIDVMLSRAWG